MSAIKCVLFDIGGVLIQWHMSWITSEISQRFQLNEDKVSDSFGNHLSRLDSGKIQESEFWYAVGNDLDSFDLQNTPESLWNTYFRKHAKQNIPVIDIVQKIKNKKYPLGVLSNIEKVTHNIVDEWSILDSFDFKFFSYQIGFSKPDSRIYQHVIQNLPFESQEILFIDDKESNVKHANDSGLSSIIFHDAKKLEDDLIRYGVLE